jgi:diguanylate cyclase (GGDEF)-like protein
MFEDETLSNHTETGSAAKAMAAIVAIIFAAEIIIMSVVASFGRGEIPALIMVIDAVLLVVLTAPFIYVLVLAPLRKEYEMRLAAEREAHDMTQLAITDPLTRIMNRRGITMALLESMAQAERYGTPLSIAMVDIDHFKRINDERGHDAGDTVLASLAGVLNEAVRMPDKVGRYGGEEFLIVLPHTTLAAARQIAGRMCKTVSERKFRHKEQQIEVTISLGLTQFRKGEDLTQLLARVDKALYEAKRGGRNRVVVSKPAAVRTARRSRASA